MRVLITGATGFVGSALRTKLRADGHRVITLSRGPAGDYDWSDEGLERGVAAADAVVHLAGENLFGRRWSVAQKQVIRESRVVPTSRLAEVLAGRGTGRPLISASAIGYYGTSEVETFDESSPAGHDYLAEVCTAWEAATVAAESAGCRVATVRTGVVFGRGGGALQKMLPPFKFGLGGPLGSGRQMVSWIHLTDLVELICMLLSRDDLSGPFNATAPEPVDMKTLASQLGRALHRPAVMPVPGFALRLALGEVADLLLTGQRVLPVRARQVGFKFSFATVDRALEDLVGS